MAQLNIARAIHDLRVPTRTDAHECCTSQLAVGLKPQENRSTRRNIDLQRDTTIIKPQLACSNGVRYARPKYLERRQCGQPSDVFDRKVDRPRNVREEVYL